MLFVSYVVNSKELIRRSTSPVRRRSSRSYVRQELLTADMPAVEPSNLDKLVREVGQKSPDS